MDDDVFYDEADEHHYPSNLDLNVSDMFHRVGIPSSVLDPKR
jgi:hypothetical protein